MIQNKHHFVLGSFVLSGIALIGTAVTILGAQTLWEDFIVIETYIEEPVNGLERGSPVKFRGIQIGKVEEITVVSKIYDTMLSYAYVRVKIFTKSIPIPPGAQIGHTVEDRVRRGLRVSLASTGITGGSYLETDYKDPAKTKAIAIDWEPVYIYVPSTPSTLSRLEVSIVDVVESLARTDIEGVVAAARDTLLGFSKAMKDLDLAGLSQGARTAVDKIGTTVTNAGQDIDALTKELHVTLREVRGEVSTTVRTADGTLARIDKLIEEGKISKSLESLAGMLANAETAVQDIRKLTARTDQTMAGVNRLVRGRSADLAAAVGNLREVLENLNTLTRTLSEYPSLLFVGNPPKTGKETKK